MTPEQEKIIRTAGVMIASHGTGLAGYPSVIPDFYAEKIEEELQKIKAVLYEIDARNSHDDSTAIPDERKSA